MLYSFNEGIYIYHLLNSLFFCHQLPVRPAPSGLAGEKKLDSGTFFATQQSCVNCWKVHHSVWQRAPNVFFLVSNFTKKTGRRKHHRKKVGLKESDKNTARLLQHGFFVQSLSSFCLLRLQVGRNTVRNTAGDHQSVWLAHVADLGQKPRKKTTKPMSQLHKTHL